MRLFIDANILVSVLNKEYPLFPFTSRILSLADQPKFKLFTTPICLAIAFYFSGKKSGNTIAKNKIAMLVEKINVAEVDNVAIQKAISDPRILDFEDGLEYYAALKVNCDCIITEDFGDFHFSEIPVYSSQDFIIQVITKL